MRVLKFEDLVNISNALYREGYGEDGLTVKIPVPNAAIMARVNEEYKYKFELGEEVDDDVNEVNIRIGGFNFNYYIDERDLEN